MLVSFSENCRFAAEGRTAEAMHVVSSLQAWGMEPDETTYNTLLKLCVNNGDLEGAEKVTGSEFLIGKVSLPCTC